MGRRKEWDTRILLPLTTEILDRVDIATKEKSRTQFIREAISQKLDAHLYSIVSEIKDMMTENEKTEIGDIQGDEPTDREVEDSLGSEGRDWVIQEFAHMAEQFDIRMHVTISVAGLIITGSIIDGETFFKELTSLARKSTDGENEESAIATYFEMKAKHYAEFNKPELKSVWPRYIHLSDAQIFSTDGSRIPTNTGLLWRGKISSIDGFSIGKLAAIRT